MLRVYTLIVREFLQLLRSPFAIGRSAVYKEVSAFTQIGGSGKGHLSLRELCLGNLEGGCSFNRSPEVYGRKALEVRISLYSG